MRDERVRCRPARGRSSRSGGWSAAAALAVAYASSPCVVHVGRRVLAFIRWLLNVVLGSKRLRASVLAIPAGIALARLGVGIRLLPRPIVRRWHSSRGKRDIVIQGSSWNALRARDRRGNGRRVHLSRHGARLAVVRPTRLPSNLRDGWVLLLSVVAAHALKGHRTRWGRRVRRPVHVLS